MDRIQESIRVILQNQAASGAFVASPAFAHYRYSWLRDGTFIAYGLDCVGAHEASAAFYRWAGATVERYRSKALKAIQLAAAGKAVPKEFLLHTRYTVEGAEVEGEWGTFQLDGYGTLLWGIQKHLEMGGAPSLLIELRPTIQLVVEYLLTLWDQPNFDCWEEYGDSIHPSTIAAMYGGISSVIPLLNEKLAHQATESLKRMKEFVLKKGTNTERLCKSVGNPDIDASLIWFHTPYHIFDATSTIIQGTVHTIEKQLFVSGGVHRYPKDVYYGGGQWILLSGFLGWYYAETGQIDKARLILEWIERQFDEQGQLPEQARDHLLAPEHYQDWVNKWGPPAKPLLWSHAMYLILKSKLAHTEDVSS